MRRLGETTFHLYFNGWSFSFWFNAFDPVECIMGVTGFSISHQRAPWSWIKIYKGDYGIRYSEGEKGKEVVGWRLRAPYEWLSGGPQCE